MVLTTSNKSRRLLVITFGGHVTADEIRAGHDDARALVSEFHDGFRVLSDLERLEVMDTDCAQEIGRMMDVFKEAGLERVFRVIPDEKKDIGLNILSVFHYGRKLRTVTYPSMVEAIKALER